MATATLLPQPRFTVFDANGNPVAGGFVHTYIPGGTTPKITWQDAAETIPNANPVPLDSAGSALIYGSGTYQLTVTDALGVAVPGYSGVTSDNVATAATLVYLPPFTGGVATTVGAKLSQFVTVTDFGALGNGVADDTAAINAAETALNAAGGGTLMFPAGTFMVTGVTKRSNTIWSGTGIGATTIKLIAGTTADAVVAGLNAYTLFGTNVLTGIDNWGLRDLTIDGNRTGGCTSDGLGVFGWVFDINYVEIKSCNGRGWHNEYGTPGIEAHQDVQSQAANMLIWDNQTDGIYYGGPNDSAFYNLNVYWNLHYGIWLWGQGTVKATSCHCWSDGIGGRQSSVAWRLDSSINTLVACVGEGSTQYQCWIRSLSNTIVSGEWFYNQASPNTAFGISLGDGAGLGGGVVAVSDNTIITRVDNCQNGAIVFSDDLGHNRIDVLGANVTAASTGYTGTPGAASRIRISISNCTTNGTLNTEALALGITGLLTAGGGLEVLGLGGVSGGGAVVAGAANSGGAGFRLLAVPN